MRGLEGLRAGARAAYSFGWVSACALLVVHRACAQQPPDVLVTASRVSDSVESVLWSADVLTRADIDADQSFSVQDVLDQLAGVEIDNTGGLGKQTSVFLRGTNSNQTLLLIDGVRVGSATLGTPPFELIPLDEIERIEVVRGPLSALYGSDAMGGVIQIFTKNGTAPGWGVDASATGGTYSTFDESLGVNGATEHLWASASGELLHTAGFDVCTAPTSPPTDCFGGPVRRDGYLNRAGDFAGGVRFGEGWTADVRSLVTSADTQYDGSYSDATNYVERVTSAHLDGPLGGGWQLRALLGRDIDDDYDFLDLAPVDRYVTRRDQAGLQLDGPFSRWVRLIVGSDWYGDHVGAYDVYDGAVSPVIFTRDSRDTTGTFLELQGTTGSLSELAGVRYEHDTQYGDHVTSDLGAGWNLTRQYRLTATWGTAFHAPTFDDLYFPSTPGFPPASNPALKPEASHSEELGFDARWDTVRASLHVYQSDISNLITYAPPDYTPINLDAARIRGVELEGEWHHDGWRVSGQATGLDPIDRSPGTSGNLLPRRAESTAFVEVRRTLGGFASLAAQARWEGQRFDDPANTVPLGGYFLLNLLGDAALGGGWTLEGRIANALGRTYHLAALENPPNPVYDYAEPGREFDLTVRYHFDDRGAR